MRLTKILLMTLIVVSSGSIFADDTAMLINLDKQWGSAGGPDGFVSDDVVGIGPTGIIGIAEVRQAAVGPSDEEYVVDGYQVNFLSADIAVMVHTASGSDPHSSLHVYQKQDGKWMVVANASAPLGE
ncbi:MAG: hypothetical protein OSB13_00530 [Porticoccaceae bacterium]|jgi:hypothetical protein|nr:hypothetical protein [Porticoccaceae bacterium]